MTLKLFSRTEIKNIILISLGSTLLAGGIAFFLLPAHLATGGTPGLAILMHFLIDVTTGNAMLLINIPLLLIGIKFIDLGFALRSIYSIIITALLVDILTSQVDFPAITSLLLQALYGGAVIGIGVGLVIKGQASAGGTTIIAKIVSRYFDIKPAKVILTLDVIIIIAVAFIFADMELALWSILSIYVTTQVIDRILSGVISEKIVHIVSTKAPQIGAKITQQLGRDGTILTGQNLAADQTKTILFVVVDARKILLLRKLVLDVDPAALMIVMQAAELISSNLTKPIKPKNISSE